MSRDAILEIATVAALSGLMAGVVVRTWWTRRTAKQRKRIPRHWPLDRRRFANTEERRVWAWMNRVFFDYQVMLKLPVTRFTLPRAQDQGEHWYTLLSGVYCTLTVCTPEGDVIGCVDVPGRAGLSRSNRQLKLSLLSQCGIAYWVIKSNNFPTLTEIREEFLGELAPEAKRSSQREASMAAADGKLRESLDKQRQQRNEALLASAQDPSSLNANDSGYAPSSGFSSLGDWQQQNSFLGALDSRKGELR